MNALLWMLQIGLALHTAMGAVWKTVNSEQTVPALQAIPHGVWLALVGLELLCSVGLILPAVSKRFASLAPIAAACIAAEMLLFSGLLLSSGSGDYGSLTYWLVVAAVCGLVIVGRLVIKPSR